MYKKRISILLVLLMVLGGWNGLFVGGNKAYAAVAFAGGTGVESDPYQISTAAQLDAVRGYTSAGIYFELIADIDLSGYGTGAGWAPINSFYGNLDGNGFKIMNLTINRPTTHYEVGLFKSIESGGTISNIILQNMNVTGRQGAGGLVYANSGTINNSSVTGSLYGSRILGGLVGNNYGTMMYHTNI
jgi:hypothetical protein